MIARLAHISILALIVCTFSLVCSAQRTADNGSSLYSDGKDDEKNQPKNVREMLEKMRIDKEKKDYSAMLTRGEEALKISEQLEKTLETTAQLTNKDLAKLESLEKLVKKIRSELGGSDDDEIESSDEAATTTPQPKVYKPNSIAEGFKALKSTTLMLVDELKKTTRFSISAAAIRSTNAVLRLARFLRFRN